jgi:UDP-glucose 4-epimerase
MASAMRGQPIKIFGQRGTVRDYLYVSDLAAAIVCTLGYGRLSETYNIGSGVGLSNMDVIEAVAPLLMEIGCELRVDHLPERAFDVKANVLDSAKLEEHTGWKPQVGFRQGLLLTRDWLRHYKSE